jgi:hypothetical protein
MTRADDLPAVSGRFAAARIDKKPVLRSPSSRRSAWRRFAPYLGSGLALLLFGVALYLLHRQVAAYHAEDVRRALAALSWARIGAALGLTGASYLLLMLYDALALRHLRKALPFARVALASFTSYAFTHSFGFGSIEVARFSGRFVSLQSTSWSWRPACRLRRLSVSGIPGPNATAPDYPRCS